MSTHIFVQEELSGLAGPSVPGLTTGFAVVFIQSDGTHKTVVFRGGPESLADARQAATTAPAGSIGFVVKAPASTTEPLPGGGPYDLVDGGQLATVNGRWAVTRGGIPAWGIPAWGILAGVAIAGAAVIYLLAGRKKR